MFAEAVPWSNVVLILGLAVSFVALVWVLGRHGGARVEMKEREPMWRYERTTAKPTDEESS